MSMIKEKKEQLELEKLLKSRHDEVLRRVEQVSSGGCPPPKELISLRRGRLAESERVLVEAHVVLCDSCSMEYLALESLDNNGHEEMIMDALEKIPVSEKTINTIRRLLHSEGSL